MFVKSLKSHNYLKSCGLMPFSEWSKSIWEVHAVSCPAWIPQFWITVLENFCNGWARFWSVLTLIWVTWLMLLTGISVVDIQRTLWLLKNDFVLALVVTMKSIFLRMFILSVLYIRYCLSIESLIHLVSDHLLGTKEELGNVWGINYQVECGKDLKSFKRLQM